MRILVTGATGRVGSRLVPRLIEAHHQVRVLLRRKEEAPTFEQLGAEPLIGDLLRPESLPEAARGVDAVVHLAAFFRGATQAEARAINQDGALALAHAAQAAGVRKFIYVSTNLVYGPGRGRPTREDDEPQPTADRFYPASKLAAERALTEFFRDTGVDFTILRLAFVYGEGDPHLQDAVNLMKDWPPAKRMHMVHHADVDQAILLTLGNSGHGIQIYNVADDMPIPVSEIRSRNGADGSQKRDAPVADPWEGIVDTAKIKGELGFHPVYPSLYDAESKGAL